MASKLLWFIPHASVGGSVLPVLEAIPLLRPEFDVVLVAPRPGDLSERAAALDVPVRFVESRGWGSAHRYRGGSLLRLGRNVASLPRMVQVVRRESPDLVVTNTLLSPLAAVAARACRVPHVWYVHEFGREDHGILFDWGEARTFKAMGRLSEVVVANSDAVAAKLARYGLADRTMRVDYSVDIPVPADLDARESRGDGEIAMVLLGALTEAKGQELAIAATAELARTGVRARLRLVGADPFDRRSELERLCESLGVRDSVEFVPYQRDTAAIYAAADVALMCSRQEAFGRVTVEAMKLGLPVVGSAAGGTAELIDDGRTGLLFQPGDAGDLAAKVATLHADPELRERMGREAAEWARTTFSPERFREQLVAAFEAALPARA